MAERRIDVEDKGAYTWDEISAHYKGKYNKKEVAAYWDTLKVVNSKAATAKNAKKKVKKNEESTEKPGVVKKAASFKTASFAEVPVEAMPCAARKSQDSNFKTASAARKSLHLAAQDSTARKNIAKEGLQKFVSNTETMEESVFAWMGWSPEMDSPCFKALHKNFPGALPGPAVFHRSQRELADFGMDRYNTIFGTSICPDEINNLKGQLADTLKDHWGECFPLGGIGGPPFVGKTGFKAFSSHVPNDGNVLIFFGPHVGITEKGEVGRYLRQGHDENSTACGACIAAYNHCRQATRFEMSCDPHDQQQSFLKNALYEHSEEISKTPDPMAALAVHAYDLVQYQLEAIVNTDFGKGNLVLIGGIQINLPVGLEDHFFPLMFEVRAKGKETIDLLETFASKDLPNARGRNRSSMTLTASDSVNSE